MKITEHGLAVLERRYLHGESPEERFRAVARTVASVEERAHQDEYEHYFYNMMSKLHFLPNSPTIINAGRRLGQLSACFVLPIEDTMEGIFQTLYNMAMVQRSGGGTGYDFSKLRPQGTLVDSTQGIASGPISFMSIYDKATYEIRQGGTRRGASIAILRIDHPDIIEFITCKSEEGKIANFNISVGITDEFIEAVRTDSDFALKWKGEVVRTVRAKDLFELIVHHAWNNGEPGVVFLDTLNKGNPTPQLGRLESTNPCGEVPLLPYESCNLGSINLVKMMKQDTSGIWSIDYDKLDKTVRLATRFLDNVIDANKYPLKEIEEASKRTRKIGLGIMGFADILIRMGIPYASEAAIDLAKEVMSFIIDVSYETSYELAEARGPYPAIREGDPKRRNASCITIAPTGSISTIADVSSGIEPIFGIAYTRKALDDLELEYVHDDFATRVKKITEERCANPEAKYREIIDYVKETGSCQDIDLLPLSVKELFKTAPEIDYEWHVRVQAAFQEYCDNSISKTINFDYNATKQDVSDAILLAHRAGCKGLTMYRVGSRDEEVLTTGKSSSKSGHVEPMKRPNIVKGFTKKSQTGCGKMYVTVNSVDGNPHEVFTTPGRSGGCTAFAEGVARLISLSLRAHVEPESIVDQLMSVTCSNFMQCKVKHDLEGKSCPDVIGRALQLAIDDDVPDESLHAVADIYHREKDEAEPGGKMVCKECNNTLTRSQGCLVCLKCGWSHCG